MPCQLCRKIRHLVNRCWHRFDKDFQPPINNSQNQGSSS